MPSYRLTSFETRGLAEPIRMMFAVVGVPYEDARITPQAWAKIKPRTLWGSLPLLEVDGKVICQSVSICRFLARQTGLTGRTALDAAVADSVVDNMSDLWKAAMGPKRQPSVKVTDRTRLKEMERSKKAAEASFLENTLPQALTVLQAVLTANRGGHGYFTADKMTWADVWFFQVFHDIIEAYKLPDVLEHHPRLEALYGRIEADPRVAKYLKERPPGRIV